MPPERVGVGWEGFLGLGRAMTLSCRTKNLSFPTRVWSPQPDRTLLDQKDSHNLVKRCSPNAPQLTGCLGSCSYAHSDPVGWGLGLCIPRKLPGGYCCSEDHSPRLGSTHLGL